MADTANLTRDLSILEGRTPASPNMAESKAPGVGRDMHLAETRNQYLRQGGAGTQDADNALIDDVLNQYTIPPKQAAPPTAVPQNGAVQNPGAPVQGQAPAATVPQQQQFAAPAVEQPEPPAGAPMAPRPDKLIRRFYDGFIGDLAHAVVEHPVQTALYTAGGVAAAAAVTVVTGIPALTVVGVSVGLSFLWSACKAAVHVDKFLQTNDGRNLEEAAHDAGSAAFNIIPFLGRGKIAKGIEAVGNGMKGIGRWLGLIKADASVAATTGSTAAAAGTTAAPTTGTAATGGTAATAPTATTGAATTGAATTSAAPAATTTPAPGTAATSPAPAAATTPAPAAAATTTGAAPSAAATPAPAATTTTGAAPAAATAASAAHTGAPVTPSAGYIDPV